MPSKKNKIYRNVASGIAIFTIVLSIMVLFGWFFKIIWLLNAFTDATMKFNTALLFLLTGIGSWTLLSQKEYKYIVSVSLALVIILISSITIMQSLIGVSFGIDTLFMADPYSVTFPGRMSNATSFSFILIGVGLIGVVSPKIILIKVAQSLLLLVSIISLVSIMAYILVVPVGNRIDFFETMSIHTSILFFFNSIMISLKNHSFGFTGLVTGFNAGSSLLRKLLPYVIITPLVLGLLTLYLTNNNYLKYDFAIAIYTVLLILISIFYNAIISFRLNRTDTERINLENSLQNLNEELRQTNQELESNNNELRQFAYIASHDLQEPLRTVSSFVDLIQEEYPSTDSKMNKYLSFISRATTRMRNLITGLLEYSRIGSEKELEEIDCIVIINEVKEDLASKINEGAATIHVSDLPKILGYRMELRLLFQNLVSNALKFCKPGIPAVISIYAEHADEKWTFTVQDNGIGIDENLKDKIFMIFQRLHNKSKYEGAGIGLAHCLKIVDLHHGDLWVESNPGEGSAFNFTIPTLTK